jgi:hypothetical protein
MELTEKQKRLTKLQIKLATICQVLFGIGVFFTLVPLFTVEAKFEEKLLMLRTPAYLTVSILFMWWQKRKMKEKIS